MAACAACCVGPIIGVLAAIGLGTVVGFEIFGAFAILVGAALIAFVLVLVLVRRRRRAVASAPPEVPQAVPVELIDGPGTVMKIAELTGSVGCWARC